MHLAARPEFSNMLLAGDVSLSRGRYAPRGTALRGEAGTRRTTPSSGRTERAQNNTFQVGALTVARVLSDELGPEFPPR
jgi:hypothetical protein